MYIGHFGLLNSLEYFSTNTRPQDTHSLICELKQFLMPASHSACNHDVLALCIDVKVTEFHIFMFHNILLGGSLRHSRVVIAHTGRGGNWSGVLMKKGWSFFSHSKVILGIRKEKKGFLQ